MCVHTCARVCVRACVRACVRVRVCVCVCVCVTGSWPDSSVTHTDSSFLTFHRGS